MIITASGGDRQFRYGNFGNAGTRVRHPSCSANTHSGVILDTRDTMERDTEIEEITASERHSNIYIWYSVYTYQTTLYILYSVVHRP